MNKIFIDQSNELEPPWVSGKATRYNPDTDSFDNPDGVFGCGKIFPWGAIEIARVSDDVPEDAREDVEALITAAPEMSQRIREQLEEIAQLHGKIDGLKNMLELSRTTSKQHKDNLLALARAIAPPEECDCCDHGTYGCRPGCEGDLFKFAASIQQQLKD